MTNFADWSRYVQLTAGAAPRQLYQDVVALFPAPGRAVDLGCGAGNESLDLLRRGWQVLAVDSSEAAIGTLLARAGELADLSTQAAELWTAELHSSDLVYAGFSLFFAPPNKYAGAWARVSAAIAPGGRFAGHFLGPRDSWAPFSKVTAHTEDEVRGLLQDLEIEHFAEVEEDGKAMNGPKHWHLYEVIAQRPACAPPGRLGGDTRV
ncbi:MAG: hypothetical protein QOH50_4090 [Kribbellaceae bacterium]|jgi:trans-aconitate methyltransferase|nr:hypothetical protein [Kribbellaceae bacterium]